MSKAKFEAAKELIDAGDLDGARRLLKTMDHPTAKLWLQKLEKQKTRRRMDFPIILAAGFLGILLVVGAIEIFTIQSRNQAVDAQSTLDAQMANAVATSTALMVAQLNTQAAIATFTPSPIPTPTEDASCWSARWWKEAGSKAVQFLDVEETALVTMRISLGPIVLQLRGSEREFEAVDYPACASDAREELRNGMDAVIKANTDFMGYDGTLADAVAYGDYGVANQHFSDAYHLLKRLGLNTDPRLADTTAMWGGEEPNTNSPLLNGPQT